MIHASFSRQSIMLLLAMVACRAGADNWHRWRGPNADGSSVTADPPIHWGEDKNIKWKVEIPGKGSSTPIIWEENIIVLTAIPTDRQDESAKKPPQVEPFQFGTGPQPTNYYQFVLLCYDRETGTEKWRSVAVEAVPHEPGHATNTYASSSPVTDGKQIFVSFGSHGIFCFDFNGRPIWKRELGKMRTRRGFGEATSPALHAGILVVPWDHEDQSFIAALDAKTGELKWKTDRDEPSTWATPLIVDHGGKTQVVTNGNTVRSYDLETGEQIWQCGGQVSNPIPTPVATDGVVYCMTGYRGNAAYAISLDAKGDVTNSSSVLWSRDDAAPYVTSPALYKGQLYFTKSLGNILTSVDGKTGEILIEQTRINGINKVYASPVAAADRIYITSREGTTVVIRHAKQLEVLATNQLGETIDASPAIVDNEMFLRGEKHLFCVVEAD